MADETSGATRPNDAHGVAPAEGLDAARLDLRTVGHCLLCDTFVERDDEGQCPQGHPAQFVSGRVTLDRDEPLPRLPRFNLAAFLLPPVWGLFYGQWVGIFFVPMWIFANNAFEIARTKGSGWLYISIAILGLTAGFQFLFALRANGLAWRAVAAKQSVATFRRRQTYWAIGAVVAWLAIAAWWYAYQSGVRF